MKAMNPEANTKLVNDVFPRVRKVLARFLKVKEEIVKPNSSLKDDLGVDSVDSLEIIAKIEEEFKVEVPRAAALKINKVTDIVVAIKEILKK